MFFANVIEKVMSRKVFCLILLIPALRGERGNEETLVETLISQEGRIERLEDYQQRIIHKVINVEENNEK